MNTSDILNRAADLIEERGWTIGPSGMTLDDRFCMEGAIQAANETEPLSGRNFEFPYLNIVRCPAGDAVKAYLELRPHEGVYEWNDGLGRTQAEVIEVLRATALVEAGRETQPAEVSA